MLLVTATSSDENLLQPLDAELKAIPPIPKATKTQAARGTVDIGTPQAPAALGRTNISERKAAHVFSMIASTGLLKQDVEEPTISASAVRRAHMKHRKLFSMEIKEIFDLGVPLILQDNG